MAEAPFFRVRREERGQELVLVLEGELDFEVSGVLEDATRSIGPGTDVLLDLHDLEFMDSAGLRLLMNLDVRSRQEGWTVALAHPRGAVARLLEVSGFQDRMAIREA